MYINTGVVDQAFFHGANMVQMGHWTHVARPPKRDALEFANENMF